MKADVDKTYSQEEAWKKGNALEILAQYLFLLIPGFIPLGKVKSAPKDFETDIVVSNLRSAGNLEAEVFGRNFIVECKNWNKPVGVQDVGYFLYRMRLTQSKFGVIFATKSITGDDESANFAQSLRLRALHQDGSICIVINSEDIESILSKATTFRSLLFEKANALRFGKSQYNSDGTAT